MVAGSRPELKVVSSKTGDNEMERVKSGYSADVE